MAVELARDLRKRLLVLEPLRCGYKLEAAVPLKSLELEPPRNPTVGFDASVGFPDAGCRVRASAAHLAGPTNAGSASSVLDRGR